ncbi:MAG: hypothetical protein FWG30_04620 [Eubacteriaceae bacterium]|nr:hypothetical protein [Eubacteriaceae bacterium]
MLILHAFLPILNKTQPIICEPIESATENRLALALSDIQAGIELISFDNESMRSSLKRPIEPNTICSYSNICTKKAIELYEQAIINSSNEGGGSFVQIYYLAYELRAPWLAKPLMNDLMKYFGSVGLFENIRKISMPSFDLLYVSTYQSNISLYARKGGLVVYANYIAGADSDADMEMEALIKALSSLFARNGY